MPSTLLSPISFIEHRCPKCKTGASFQAVNCSKCSALLGKVTLSPAFMEYLGAIFGGLSQGSIIIDEGRFLKNAFEKCPSWGEWLRWKMLVVLLSRASEQWVPTINTQLKNVATSFPHIGKDVDKVVAKLQGWKGEIDSALRRINKNPVPNPLEAAFLAYYAAFTEVTGRAIERKVAGTAGSAMDYEKTLAGPLAEVDRVNNALVGQDALEEAHGAFNDHVRDVAGSGSTVPPDMARASLEWDALGQAFRTAVGQYPRELILSVRNSRQKGGHA